jgi:hypothetical protein
LTGSGRTRQETWQRTTAVARRHRHSTARGAHPFLQIGSS